MLIEALNNYSWSHDILAFHFTSILLIPAYFFQIPVSFFTVPRGFGNVYTRDNIICITFFVDRTIFFKILLKVVYKFFTDEFVLASSNNSRSLLHDVRMPLVNQALLFFSALECFFCFGMDNQTTVATYLKMLYSLNQHLIHH